MLQQLGLLPQANLQLQDPKGHVATKKASSFERRSFAAAAATGEPMLNRKGSLKQACDIEPKETVLGYAARSAPKLAKRLGKKAKRLLRVKRSK